MPMKTHLFISRIVLILFLFVASTSHAQIGMIDSLKILPKIPTTLDSIKVVSYATFSSGGCEMVNYEVSMEGNEITVDAFHRVGMLTVICNSTNTINLSQLVSGNYNITYNLREGSSQLIYDTETISFYVNVLPHSVGSRGLSSSIKIYPNPFNSSSTISFDKKLLNPLLEIKIYNMLGQEMKQINNMIDSKIIFNRGGLTKGLYFVNLINNNRIIAIEKIIIE